MALLTAFTELVRCPLPIQQAPMGSVSTPGLAVAVADAGGLGSITAFGMSATYLTKTIESMTARTQGRIAANFLTPSVDRDALEVAASLLPVVDFFWARPEAELVDIVHAGGALACWQVGSVTEADEAADVGCDLIAVQGVEAGGHVRGTAPLLPLLAAVLDRVTVPVLAAGGVAHGRSLAAVLAAGAAGARIGTRFIPALESGAHPSYKQAIIAAGFGATEITDAFSDCPLCASSPRARVLTGCIREREGLGDELAGETLLGRRSVTVPAGSGLPPSETTTGHVAAMAMYASESSALVVAEEPAAEIVAQLCHGAEALLRPTGR